MATPSGPQDSDVKEAFDVKEYYGGEVGEELRREPWNFQFFQAVRLLERLSGGQPVGRFGNPGQEAVRFSANAAMGFPPSQIHSLEWPEGAQPELTVNFFGLNGPMGALPRAYSELVNERGRARDHALQEFFDLFHHRLLSLFYQAWEKYRFPVAFERDRDDRFTHYLLDFIGLGTQGLRNRQLIHDESLAFYTGLLSMQPRSAMALRQILSDYFSVPVEIEQFVGAWFALSEPQQSRVGEEREFSEQLGRGAVAGDEVWDCQCTARIVLGPLSLAQYLDFLPTGTAFAALAELTRIFSRREIDFELQLVLARVEAPPILLDEDADGSPKLGWTTWLKGAPFTRDPGETVLQLQ